MFLARRVSPVFRVLTTLFIAFLALVTLKIQPVQAGGFTKTDFLVAGYYNGVIAIYDENWNFKSYLDADFPLVSGLDILPNGNVVAYSQYRTVRIYDPSGAIVGGFSDDATGYGLHVKASPNNRLYFATQSSEPSVREFDLGGNPLRDLGSKSNTVGFAVLPNNILWTVELKNNSVIDVINLSTGSVVNTIALDNGQSTSDTLFYSSQTNTVLMSDIQTYNIYERTTNGTFVRKFVPPLDDRDYIYGITRGPSGNVYATALTRGKVLSWNSSGTYLGSIDISSTAGNSYNIIWMGNAVPESTPNSSVNATGTLKNSNGSIQASLSAANNKNGLGGSLSYTDKYNKVTIQSTKITVVNVQGNQARVYGECKVNGEAGYTFIAVITDAYPTFLGRGDSLQLDVSNGYSGGGVFNPGDAKVTGAPINVIN